MTSSRRSASAGWARSIADGVRIGYTLDSEGAAIDGKGYVVETSGGVPRPVCEHCGVYTFLFDSRRVLATFGRLAIRLVDMNGVSEEVVTAPDGQLDRPGHPPSRNAWTQIDEPTATARPTGWSPDSRVLYLLLDTDGFRCLWGQRIDESGRPVGRPYAVRHFHQAGGGFSTSLGNAITVDGFLCEGASRTANIWRLRATPAQP